MAGDPDFASLLQQYGGGTAAQPAAEDRDDPLYGIPKEWETVHVILDRGEPVRVQAPGAAGRRVGGEPDEPTGPTVTGGGARRISLADLLRDYYRLDGKALAEYQQALWAGGFYSGKATPAFGVADERGFSAFKAAALRAARSEKTFSEVLDEAVASGAGDTERGRKRAPLTVQVSNPQEIARMARAAAQEILGRGDVAPEQIQAIVSRYQAQEASTQTNAYNASFAGGTFNEAPGIATFVQDELERLNPVEAEAYRGADQVMAAFGQIVGGPFGG